MSSPERIVIGTRGSKLALIQADITSKALKALQPSVTIEVRVIQTHGDTNQNPIPLDTIGKGWFTKEIESALSSGEIDLAVHSLKDMAEDMPMGLHIGAYLEREDARDVLVTRNGESLKDLKNGALVGTDSARRQAQILALRPELRVASMRGNVPTRLEKVMSGSYDAAILAAAGLKRLGLADCIVHYFETDEMTPSPGQGVLALQSRISDISLNTLLTQLNDEDASHAAILERSFSRAVGGGCKSPTGAYAKRVGTDWVITGMIVDDSGHIVRKTLRASSINTKNLGENLARDLLEARNNGANA